MPRGTKVPAESYYDRLVRVAEHQFGMKPEMVVQIGSNYNGNGRLLQWVHSPPHNPRFFPNYKFYGHFACFPLQVHDGGKLTEEVEVEKEPTIEVPRRLMEQVSEASRSGAVTVETVLDIKELLTKKS